MAKLFSFYSEPAPSSENSALPNRYYFISGTVIVVGVIFSLLLILRCVSYTVASKDFRDSKC